MSRAMPRLCRRQMSLPCAISCERSMTPMAIRATPSSANRVHRMRPASTGAGRPYSDGVDALDERRRATIPNDPKFSGWLVWAVAGCWFMDGWTRCVWDRETGLYPPRTWRLRCGVPRPPTASTRSALARRISCTPTRTRTGRPGTPHTWWPSRPGRTCRRDGCVALPWSPRCGGQGGRSL